MFGLKRNTLEIHLKSGQTCVVTCSKYEVEENDEGIVSYRLEGLYPRFSIPISQMSAIVYRRPLWERILYRISS